MNLFDFVKQKCALWTWVLSLEMQFLIVACIVLLILKNHPRYGITIFFSFFTSSFVATTALRFHAHRQPPKANSKYKKSFVFSISSNVHASFSVLMRAIIWHFSMDSMINRGLDCRRIFSAFVLVTFYIKQKKNST